MKTAHASRSSGTAELLAKAADEFLKAAEAGSSPTIDEFVERYPQIAAVLRDVLPALTLMNSSPAESRANGPSADDLIDRTLGDFRLIREIGRGGMGVVYDAEQISLGRSVALKVLPFAGVLDEKQLQRFKNEARAAAALEHPHIVPVYSVGCERGVHYYAMRLIDGQSLAEILQAIPDYRANRAEDGDRKREVGDRKSDRSVALTLRREEAARDLQPAAPSPGSTPLAEIQPPSPDTRPNLQALITTNAGFDSLVYFRNVARLGSQVAEALAYAHERGILHRDIKPGNLLLDVHGNLWIADFGLARLESDAGMTMTGDMLGTLRYMSPEQASGQRVLDERSDVYSLGVTLYEMLVLRPAFSGNDRQEILRRIASDDPKPPRQITPRLPRDLETIILRAIAKEPTSRYQTALDFADDLQRFLRNQPIQARRPRFVEKCVKWSRRHPAAVLSAVIIAGVIAIASTVAALLINSAKNDAVAAQELEHQSRERADQQAQLALKSLKLVVNEIQTKLKGVPGAAGVRRTLLNTAIDGLKEVARNRNTAANADHALVQSHLDLGDAFYLTGEIKSAHGLEEALAQFQAAHDIAVKLAERIPHDIRTQRDLSVACERMGNVNMALGKVTAARDFFQKELEVSQKLVDENPQNAEVRRDLAVAYQFQVEVDLRLGNVAAARSASQKCLEMFRKLADENPANVSAHAELATVYQKLGDVNLKLANLPAARDAFQKELEIERKLAQDDAANIGLQDALTMSYRRFGNVELQLGNVMAARDACQKAVAISQQLVGTDPESGFRRGLSIGYEYLGDVDLQLGDFAAASEDARKFVELSEKLARGDPNDVESQRYLSVAYERLGIVNSRVGKVEAARDAYQKFVEISEKLAQQDPHDTKAQRSLALSYERLGGLNLQTGSIEAAHDAYHKFSGIIQKLAEQDPNNAEAQRDLAVSLYKVAGVALKLGDVPAARDKYKKSLEIRQKLAQEHPESTIGQSDLAHSYESLGSVSLRLGDATAARDAFKNGLAIKLKMVEDHPTDPGSQSGLPLSYQKLGDAEGALSNFSAARDAYQRLFEIAQKLSRDNPRDNQSKHNLSIAFDRLAGVNMQLGKISAAREAYHKYLALNQELSQTNPQNIDALRQVAIAYQNLSALDLGLANLPAARDAGQMCVESFQKIAHKDLSNAQAQRDLCWSFKKLGEIYLQMGNGPAARDAYQVFFDSAQKAAAADSKSPESKNDLAAAYQALGDVHLRLGSFSTAHEDYEKSLGIFQSLVGDVPQADVRSDLAHCYGRLAHLDESVEDFPAAVRWLEQEIPALKRSNTDKLPESRESIQRQQQLTAVCKLAPQAIDSLDFALAQSKEIVPELLGMRCRALSRRGNAKEAAAAAEKLNSLDLADGQDRFEVALGFALCAQRAQPIKPEATTSDDAKASANHYAGRAVELLERARGLGFFKNKTNRDSLKDNADFDVLRGRDDFNRVMEAIFAE